MHRSGSVAIIVVVAAVAGYAMGTRPTLAQANPFPFTVGDSLTFTKPDGGTLRGCRVEDIRGTFVRCGPPSRGESSWTNVSVMTHVDVKTAQ
jgi:hypothetical protein